MKKLGFLSIMLTASVCMFSCTKEGGSAVAPGEKIQGTWKFVDMDIKTSSAVEGNDGTNNVKTVTTSDYTSTNNAGTFVIDASTIQTNAISYSVHSTAESKIYLDGTLTNTLPIPLDFDAPASSSTSSYQLVGADSIYITSGSIVYGDISVDAEPSGAKISLQGDVLTIKAVADKVQNISGFINTIHAEQTLHLKRQ